ncbi:MAG: hypothetical protein ACK54C_01960 [Betaproteobacteria bacterium]
MSEREPLLASRVYTKGGIKYSIQVHGGLHYIRGNSAPYFSITADQYRKCRDGRLEEDSFGAQHELIERLFPGWFTGLIALHLSDIDGVPSHGGANAIYYARGGQWLGKLSRMWLPIEEKYGSEEQASDEYLIGCLMRHLRCGRVTARALRAAGKAEVEHEIALRDYEERKRRFDAEKSSGIAVHPGPPPEAHKYREYMTGVIEAMRPRWKAEAEACITKHGLKLYGDHWQPKGPVTGGA